MLSLFLALLWIFNAPPTETSEGHLQADVEQESGIGL